MTHRIPVGPFELYQPIGKGGMGEVWEGLHVLQQIPVAVKVLTRASTHAGERREAFTQAFWTEVRAAAALRHPGIVTLLDYGEIPAGAAKLSEGAFEAGSPYIVMELASRGCLQRYQKNLGWRELRVVLSTVLEALAHAHACGVIHRDLKPANILVGCGVEGELGIKITDFGLAHALEQHEAAHPRDSGWGTPQFMAPEQFRGAWRDYGPWTDLYAIGIMAFILATGASPFEPDANGFGLAHLLAVPREFEPRFQVPDGFEKWVARLIQKRPEERFQSAADAAWALQRLIDPPIVPLTGATVSLLPMPDLAGHHVASTDGAAQRERRNTERGMSGPPVDDAPTMIDRADTTQIVLGDVDVEHRTMTRSQRVESRKSSARASASNSEVPPMPHTWRAAKQRPPSLKLVGAGLGLFGLRTMPMVNRDVERDFLWSTLRAVREEGSARAVLIRGSAGTGKSWLARWLCLRAQEVGTAVVLRAGFSPIAGPGDGLSRMVSQQLRAGGMSYAETTGRVTEMLERWGVRDPVEIQALSDFLKPVARAVARSGARSGADAISIRTQQQDVRYGLLYRHLQRLADQRPVVVWFDDVQWGADALAFAQFVIERQHQTASPILFVMTARNEALVARAVETKLIGELARNRRTVVLDVDPLDAAHTAELVRELLFLSDRLAEEVEQRCGGNPLFAVQLVGDWVAGDRLRFSPNGFELRPGASAAIPDDLFSIWRERLDLLLRRRPPQDLVALEIASALRTSIDLGEWHVACEQYGAPLAAELSRELLESGLAIATESGFEFCHGLFRESLEQGARNADRWTAINAACLRMLEARYPQRQFPFAERYALHVAEAGAPQHAIEPLLQAARERTGRSEYPVAISLLDQRDEIIDAFETDTDERDRVAGWTTRAQIALWQGSFEEAEQFASKAGVEARRGGWMDLLGRATLAEGLCASSRGDLAHAEGLLRAARHSMKRADDPVGEGECVLALGRVEESRGEFDVASDLFEEARATMVGASYSLGEAQCLNALGDVARARGQSLEARRFSLEAREIFESLHNSIGVADCTNDLAELSRIEGDLGAASNQCSIALQMYESLGSEHSMHVRTNLALTLAAQGKDPQARQLLEEVRARFLETGQSGPFASATMLLLPILGRLDEFRALEHRFAEAAPIIERTGVKGRDVLIATLQTLALLDDSGRSELAARIREFAGRSLT